jgi:hypothetical protein
MKPIIILTYIIPILIIVLRLFINPWIILVFLIIGFLATYHYYQKTKNKDLINIIIFYILIIIFILVSLLIQLLLSNIGLFN